MHQRLGNEFVLRLTRRAMATISPCLREEEWQDAFKEFHRAFKEEFLWYEEQRSRMEARLKMHRASKNATADPNSSLAAE